MEPGGGDRTVTESSAIDAATKRLTSALEGLLDAAIETIRSVIGTADD